MSPHTLSPHTLSPHTPRHFAWQAWHKLTSTYVLHGRRGTNSHLLSFCVAGVGQMALGGALGRAWAPVTPRHFVWQAWDNLTSTFVSRGRCGTNSHLLSFCVAGVGQMALCVAGVAQTHMYTVVSRGRRGTNSHLLSFRVAGVGQMALGGALGRAWAPVTPRHFVWQAWHNLTSTFVSRGRRRTNSHLLSFCVAGVGQMALGGALGRAWAPVTPRHFVWQAWHNLTSTFVSRGRRRTNSHLLSFCVAGVGQMALGGALGRAWAPVTPRHFVWQAWHKLTSTVVSCGRHGTNSHLLSFCVAGVALTALGWLWWRTGFPDDAVDAAVSCVAGAALGDIHLHFAWQAWHLVTSTVTLRGRRGSDGTGLALVARLVPRLRLTHTTCSHTTCSHTTCPHTQLVHTQLVLTQLVLTCNLLTDNLLTHNWSTHNLSTHTTYSHTTCSHTGSLLHTPILHHLFSLSLHFPCHLYLSIAACWKKLTCGVIRSFIFFFFEDVVSTRGNTIGGNVR